MLFTYTKIINAKSPELDDEELLMVMVNNSSGNTPVPDTGLFDLC